MFYVVAKKRCALLEGVVQPCSTYHREDYIPLAVWMKKQLRKVIGTKPRMVFSRDVSLGTHA
jgi:hypothetical protein